MRKRKGEGEREREKEREGERERKEERGKKKRYLKVFLCSTLPPSDTFPSTVPLLAIARERHNSHKGGTREKHNFYKW